MRLNNLFSILAVALLAIGCGKNEDVKTITPISADYNGTVSVVFNGASFDNPDINVNLTPSADGKTASIIIYKIKFVPQMPVTIDVTIPDINLTSDNKTISLAKDMVVPLALGGEYPRYTVTNLKGTIEGERISFSLNFGDYPTSFTGTKRL
jgi:hypothetical protein